MMNAKMLKMNAALAAVCRRPPRSTTLHVRRSDFGIIYRSGDRVIKQHCMKRDGYDKEYNVLSRIRHGNIISPLRSYVSDNKFCVEYRYYEEGDLHQWMSSRTPTEVRPSFYRIAEQAARSLECVHKAGMVHLDVKPENYLVDGTSIVLIDFETAEEVHETDPYTLSYVYKKKGTDSYMAPEMMKNAEYSPRSDIYSLGIMFYLILCYRFPDRVELDSSVIARSYPEFEKCLVAMLQPNHRYRPDIHEVLEQIRICMRKRCLIR